MRKRTKLLVAGVGLLSVALVAAGCQTYGEAAGLGGAIGAGTGALIGHHNPVAGALIGGAVGALAGVVAHDIKVKRARTAQETAQQYNYQPSQGEVLKMESNEALPSAVRPGNLVEGTMQYALLGVGSQGAQVVETRTLKRGDQIIAESSKTVVRGDGTWVSTQQFQLPNNAPLGQYTMEQVAQTPRSRIMGTSVFNVQ